MDRCGRVREEILKFYPKIDSDMFERATIKTESIEIFERKAKKLMKWWKPIYELSEPGNGYIIDLWKDIMEEIKIKRKP
jgi:hypothetical protein